MMISGAPISIRWRRRLFRLMTRRYRSLRSLVANRPPSSWTMGRRSGGSTGRTVTIIHSGLLPLFRNASTTRSCLLAFLRLWPDEDWVSRSRFLRTSSKSTSLMICRMASAPILASKTSPCFCFSSWYWLSLSNSFTFRFLSHSTSFVRFSSSCIFSSVKLRRSWLTSSTLAPSCSIWAILSSTAFWRSSISPEILSCICLMASWRASSLTEVTM